MKKEEKSMDYVLLAKAVGFDEAKLTETSLIPTDPSYRKYCEQNVCGNYNLAYGCPPKCGSVEHMVEKMNAYQHALVLQKKVKYTNLTDRAEQEEIQKKQNKLTEVLADLMKNDGLEDILFISAGPWKKNSCISAYCIDAQKLADSLDLTCWKDDGYVRYFTLLLF